MKLQRSGQGNALPILREERQFSKSQRYEFFQHYQPRLPENMHPTNPKTKAILARARKSSSSLSGGRWQRPGKQILCGKVYMTGLLLPFEQTSSHYWIWKVQKKRNKRKKNFYVCISYICQGEGGGDQENISAAGSSSGISASKLELGVGCPKKSKSLNFGMPLTPVVFIG